MLADSIFNPGAIVGFFRAPGIATEVNGRDHSNRTDFYDLSGRSVAIVGKNGSGKTETLTHMALSLQPWHDTQIKRMGSHFWSGGFVVRPNDPAEGLYKAKSKWPKALLSWDYVLPHSSRLKLYWSKIAKNWAVGNQSVELAAEISQQGLYCQMPHRKWNAYRKGFNQEENFPTHILIRLIQISHNTPNAMNERDAIRNSLKKIAQSGKSLNFQKVLEIFEKGDRELGIPRLLDFRLFTPWVLGGGVVWEADNDIIKALSNLQEAPPSIVAEWPSLEEKNLIASAIDSTLLSLESLSDREQLKLCVSVQGDSKFLVNKQVTDEGLEGLKPRVKNLLLNWKVLPIIKTELKDSEETDNLTWFTKQELFNDEGNFHFEKITLNNTSRAWIRRAFQIAILELGDSPYKIALWDEPELGLHPTALDAVVQHVLPSLSKVGVKLIFTTHAIRLASGAEKSLVCSRGFHAIPELIEMPDIDEKSMAEIGFTKIDLLSSLKQIVIVEGEHDRIVLETLFGEDFQTNRAKILTMSGTENLLSIPGAELIINFLDADISVILDGRSRSQLTEESLNKLNLALKNEDYKSCSASLQELRRKSENGTGPEGKKLVDLVELILKRSDRTSINSLSRWKFFMFGHDDVIHYLDPSIVLSLDNIGQDWTPIREKWRASGRKQREKDYYRSMLKADLDTRSVRKAAVKLLDNKIDPDFQKVRKFLFD